MKKAIKILVIAAFLGIAPFVLNAQTPPHPNGGGGPGGGNTPVGGGAPIDGGLSILVALGAIYGYKKFNQQHK
jgi:hypothetical protein